MSAPVLFLSAHLPVQRSRQAGHKTAWRNLCWFAERQPVHLACFRSEGDRSESLEALKRKCERVHVVDVSKSLRLTGLLTAPQLPLAVAARNHSGFRTLVRAWSSEVPYARVHVEWTQMAAHMSALQGRMRTTLYVHDVLSQWTARKATPGLKGSFWRWESARTQRWESEAYQGCDTVYVPSGKDRDLIASASPRLADRIRVLPLHFDRYGSVVSRRYSGPLRLLFWGALGRSENAEGARWLCRELMPQLRTAGVQAVLTLAGSNPPADLLAQVGPDVEVTGFLDDPSDVFTRAHLAVAPLFQGAGVKVKVLECLAVGLPTVTTEVGAEGIQAGAGDGLTVLPPDARRFAEAIQSLDRNRDLLMQQGRNAIAWTDRNQQDDREILLR